VTFDIDANGILNVSAKEKASGSEQRITITGSGSLDRSEIDRMMAEAEANAERDAELRELQEVRNDAERLIASVERTLRDQADKVDEPTRGRLEEKITALKGALEQNDLEATRSAFKELEAESHEMTKRLYEQSGATPEGETVGAAAGASSAGDDVIDADFKEDK